jgi:hypothetical protein
MNMVRHYLVANNKMSLLFKVVKPFIKRIIAVCDINKRHPLITGKCNKVNSIFMQY